MKIVNLTSESITIISGEQKTMFAKSDNPVFAKENLIQFDHINCENHNIPVKAKTFGSCENLPKKEKDTIYIVPEYIKELLKDRSDLVSTGEEERDELGLIIGYKSLIR